MPVIMNPVDLLNQASDYTTELTWSQSSSSIKDATFFYLKTPTSNPDSNTNLDWGDCLGKGKIDISNLYWRPTGIWTKYGRVQNAYSVENNISEWPSAKVTKDEINNCYEIKKDTSHWNDVFAAYKSSIERELGVRNITEDDISSIILKPYKFSMNNEPDGYHVDCKIEVKCRKAVTATFYVQDASQNQDRYYQVESKNYKTNDIVEFPNYTDKDGYDFSGWYLDEELNEAVPEGEYSITDNVSFYAKYTPDTYTVTWENWNHEKIKDESNVRYGTTASAVEALAPTTDPTRPSDNRYDYNFTGWSPAYSEVTGNQTYTAQYEAVEKVYTVTWENWNHEKIKEETDVHYGTTASAVEALEPTDNPTRPSDDRYDYNFTGWSPAYSEVTGNQTYTAQYEATEKENPPTPVTDMTYTIIQNFIDGKGNKIEAMKKETPKTIAAEEATKVKDLNTVIPGDMKTDFTDSASNKYMYVPTKTEFSTTTLVNGTKINLYYYLDVIGETTKEFPDGGSDNIPDCYQVTINYVDDNTGRGKITGLTTEVKTIRDESNNPVKTGTVQASGSTAEATGSRNYFSNWANDAGLPTSSTAKLGKQTFNAEGGKTYTFTANFDRSSGGGGGSSRPSTPTVTIPDDVPTGLNGKDHYAYIIGYGNNDVRPQNNITRAEVATIFFRLLTDETREANMTKSNSYNDVKDGDWFCCAVSTLSKMGIIKGYEDGSFKPNDPISRAEFAAIAARFDPDGDKTPATFADVTSHWAKDEISIAATHGWIKGYEDGSFKPDQKITRAETMTLVNRVLNRLPEAKDDLHKDMKTWVDNMDETAWYYLAVQEATNSHYFKNKTGTKFEQWTDLRDTRDWSELEK